jgi:hypothetical protein
MSSTTAFPQRGRSFNQHSSLLERAGRFAESSLLQQPQRRTSMHASSDQPTIKLRTSFGGRRSNRCRLRQSLSE